MCPTAALNSLIPRIITRTMLLVSREQHRDTEAVESISTHARLGNQHTDKMRGKIVVKLSLKGSKSLATRYMVKEDNTAGIISLRMYWRACR